MLPFKPPTAGTQMQSEFKVKSVKLTLDMSLVKNVVGAGKAGGEGGEMSNIK